MDIFTELGEVIESGDLDIVDEGSFEFANDFEFEGTVSDESFVYDESIDYQDIFDDLEREDYGGKLVYQDNRGCNPFENNDNTIYDGKLYQSFENTNQEKNIIYIDTRNKSLENDVHPITGVPFYRKQVEMPNGESVEGVFPEFDSVIDVQLPEDMYEESDSVQFKEANSQLLKKIESDYEFRKQFSEEQIEQIKDGAVPDGYVWHHSEEPGKLQLVDSEIHSKTGHTGGRSLWGGGNENR